MRASEPGIEHPEKKSHPLDRFERMPYPIPSVVPKTRAVFACALAVVVVLGSPIPALSQTTAAKPPVGVFENVCEFRLVYGAPSGCPDREEVERNIYAMARTQGRARKGPDPVSTTRRDGCPTTTIYLKLDDQGQHARLEIRDEKGHTVSRDVTGASCQEVCRAAAIVAGLSLVSEPPDQATSGRSVDPEGLASDTDSKTRSVASVRGTSGAVVQEASRSGSNQSTSWGGLAGARVFVLSAATPRVVVGFAGVVGVQRTILGPWVPRLCLSLGRTQRQLEHARSGDAAFRVTLAQLEACAVQWPAGQSWAIRPCTQLQVGWLAAEGIRVDRGVERKVVANWRNVGISVAVERTLFRHLGVEAQGSVLAPWSRGRFWLPPAEKVHEVPKLGWAGALTLTAYPWGT